MTQNERQASRSDRMTTDTIQPKQIPKKIITTIANEPEKSSIRMYVKYSRVDEDLGWKVPLVWDYNDVTKIKGFNKLIETIKNKKVIEIGGGNGYLAYIMAHFAKHVDTFEGWAPYSVVYHNYIFPEVVKKRLSLNYIIKYVTEEDLEYLGKYDVGVYSGLDKHKEILEMLSKISEKIIWVTFCNVKEKKKVGINLDVCVFDLDEEQFFYKTS